ncbi:hypothetical protein [Streptomyces sp. NPDC054887]
MLGIRVLGTGVPVLALALTVGICGTAHAAGEGVAGTPHAAVRPADRSAVETVTATGTADGEPVVARCPAGTRAVGGGVRTHGAVDAYDTYPAPDGAGWIGSARGPDPRTPITVYAVCA